MLPVLKVITLPKGGWILQDTSHDVHLSAAVAETLEEIQIVIEEAAIQLNENLIHHKRCHNSQWTKLLLSEHSCVHFLQSESTKYWSHSKCLLTFTEIGKRSVRQHSVALTDHPLHYFVHQQLLFYSRQQEKLQRFLNDRLPQSVHHICWKLLNGAYPARNRTNTQEQNDTEYLFHYIINKSLDQYS